MSTTTTNYGLIKPDTTDPILIGQLNDNSDAIDAALKENADAIENKPDAADIPAPSTAAPAMDGTAAAGTSTDYARADHVHPSDTSKQDALSAAQLAAANSGIDSAKVAQIETNKNNILTIYENDKSLNRLKFNGFNASNANGVEYTINADFSITANGTPSGSISYIYLYFNGASRNIDSFCNGNYVLSGCPEGGSNSTYRLYAAAGSYAKVDYGDGVLLDDTSQTGIVVIIAIYNGYTANNLTFKPMICTKELWDISHKYEPNTDLIDNICECFGDSLTWYDGNDYTSGVYEGYPCVGYESYLRDYLGMTVNNNGISGATTPQICAAIKNKSTTALNAASHILIMGGDNDDRLSINVGTLLPVGSAFDKTTVIGALQDMVEWLITNAPQTRIVLMTEPMGWTYRDNAMERVDDVYPEAYRKVAAQYGLPLIDNWYNSGINEYNRSTYINDRYAGNTAYMYHPNNAGWRRIGSYIVKCLKNL